VVERLGPGGVLIVDETGFIKKGTRSAGVGRQYTGTTGKIDNCQVGVFARTPRQPVGAHRPGAVSGPGPEPTTATGPAPPASATTSASRPGPSWPELARSMLTRAIDAGVPAGWLTADEISGLLAELSHAACRHHQEPPPPPPAPPPTPPPPPAPAPAPAPAAREDGLTPEVAKPATKTGP
jgi:hypothetical protein